MKCILKSDLRIEDVLVGHAGDILEVYDARPDKGEPKEAVAGYCDIFNFTTGEKTWTTCSEAEGLLEPVSEAIVSYYECEFRQDDPENGPESMCIKGERIPTPEEATTFLAKDIADWYHAPVVKVLPLTEAEARDCFCLDNEKEWPIFQ